MKCTPINRLLFFSLLAIFFIIFGCANQLRHLNTAEKKTPSDLEKIAQKYYEFNKYDSCIKVYKELIKRYGDQADRYEKQLAWANYEIGFCYLVTRRYDKSLIYFKEVLNNYSTLAPTILARQRIEEIRIIKSSKKIKRKKKGAAEQNAS